jgi:MoxR-like ATPase
MDYISRYGLDFNPFIKNTHDIIIETSEYREIIYRLNFLLNNKGFGVITGGPGRGKTTVVRNWAKTINTSLYKVIYTSLSTLTVSEFYKHLAVSLDLEPAHKKTDNFIKDLCLVSPKAFKKEENILFLLILFSLFYFFNYLLDKFINFNLSLVTIIS